MFSVLLWFVLEFIIAFTFGKRISINNFLKLVIEKYYYKKNSKKYSEILNNIKFQYYQNLQPHNKQKFLKRVSDFMLSKEFIAREVNEISLEQKIYIASSAIQLTFGLDKYLLSYFSKIYIYPHKYYSKLKNEFHKGEVNLNGAIVLSYEDFILGYNNDTDGINLGLHEMGHALSFDLLLKKESEYFYINYHYLWKEIAKKELEDIKDDDESFLRSYAKTNLNEFFAVCTENFFERPLQFKNTLPELYDRLVILFNQDLTKEDMLISPSKTFTYKHIYNGEPPLKVIYSNRFPFFNWIVKALLLSLILAFFIFVAELPIIIIGITTIIYLLYQFIVLLLYKKFLVYENCLAICPFTLRRQLTYYDYKSIVLIYVRYGRKPEIVIKYNNNGEIKEKAYFWFHNPQNLKLLLNELSNKDIKIIK